MEIKTKVNLGVLIIIILLSGYVYITMDHLKIRIDNDKSTFYVKDGRWLVSGREINSLFDGTTKLNRRVTNITINTTFNYITNKTKVVRITPYIRGPVIIDTYEFYGNNTIPDLFPVSHTVEIINGSGFFYKYEVRDLDYDGSTFKLNGKQTSMNFGKNMKVTWWKDYRLGWIYESGSMYVKSEKIQDDYMKFDVRLFDPILSKIYDKENQTIIFKDKFGVEFDRVTLITKADNKLIIPGINRTVAIMKFNSMKEAIDGVSHVYFYDKNMTLIHRPFYFQYKTSDYKLVNNTKLKCDEIFNTTLGINQFVKCERIVTGYELKEVNVTWHDIGKKVDLGIENITIRVITNVYPGDDHIEWIPVIHGEIITEWGTFSDGLRVGLIHVYKYSEGSGTIMNDSIGGTNITVVDSWIASGINGSSYNCSKGNSVGKDTTINPGTEHGTNEAFTMSWWFIPDGQISNDWFFHINSDNSNGKFNLYTKSTTEWWLSSWDSLGQEYDSWSNHGTSQQVHTLVGNSSGFQLYVDGELNMSLPMTAWQWDVDTILIWRQASAGYDAERFTFDEFYIWNRSLTGTEVSDLSDAFWTPEEAAPPAGDSPIVSLNTPVEGYNSTGSVTFNCSAVDSGVLNITLFIDGVAVHTVTNSSASQNLTLQNTTVFSSDASKNWTCKGANTNGKNTTITRNFTIDVTSPLVSISNPTTGNKTTNISSINYTASDTHIDKCWYSLDDGDTNSSGVSVGTNFTTLTSTEGSNNWTVWCNDTFGNENSSSIYFWKDTVYPLISIDSPSNNTNTTNTGLDVTFTQTENNTNICWWTNDSGSTNYTLSSCEDITTETWSQGTTRVIIYVNDTSNNVNSTRVTFTVDNLGPLITIGYPLEINYTSVTTLNYTVTDAVIGASSCWYSNNSGDTNYSIVSAGTNWSGMNTTECSNTWIVYCNDSLGNENSTSTTFLVDTTAPTFDNARNISNNANTSLSESYSATDVCTYVGTYTLNDTSRFNISSAGLIINVTNISTAELYWLNVSVNDSLNNLNSQIFYINITKVTVSNASLNSSLNTGITSITFRPNASIVNGVAATGQNSSHSLFIVHNNHTQVFNIDMRVNVTNTAITLKCNDDNSYDTSTALTTSYQTINGSLDIGNTTYIWCWADYNNPTAPWYPAIGILGRI